MSVKIIDRLNRRRRERLDEGPPPTPGEKAVWDSRRKEVVRWLSSKLGKTFPRPLGSPKFGHLRLGPYSKDRLDPPMFSVKFPLQGAVSPSVRKGVQATLNTDYVRDFGFLPLGKRMPITLHAEEDGILTVKVMMRST